MARHRRDDSTRRQVIDLLSGIIHPPRPGLVIGLTSPIGTPLGAVEDHLEEGLTPHGYQVTRIRISEVLERLASRLGIDVPVRDRAGRYHALMDAGNRIRESTGQNAILAYLVATTIVGSNSPAAALEGSAVLVHQLKHPDEVTLFRQLFGDAFVLLGVHCPARTREGHLVRGRRMTRRAARGLIQRDQGEEFDWGQRLRDAFHQADAFLVYPEEGADDDLGIQVRRLVSLLLGTELGAPTREEMGMYLAQAAALRSADLSRQVGAAILNDFGDVLAVGCNEVPAPGGGQYWEEDDGDARDKSRKRPGDANARMIQQIVDELSSRLPLKRTRLVEALRGTRLFSLTEFGRPVHAEMAALLAALRSGTPVTGASLYCTTFPCHNCAKHIVASGLSQVIYIEPYPKSLAFELHGDAIRDAEQEPLRRGEGQNGQDPRTFFRPFRGIAPRLFARVFSSKTWEGTRIKRKNSEGDFDLEVIPRFGSSLVSLDHRLRAAREHLAGETRGGTR